MKLQHAFRAAALLYFVGVCLQAHAVEPYQEYRKRVESAQTLTALTDQLMGDSVSLYNGATQFSVTDIDLPGNNALPVQLNRRFSVELSPSGVNSGPLGNLTGAGNWDVDIPSLSGTYISGGGWPSNRCSVSSAPNPPPGINQTDIWHGNTVHVPGASDRTLLLADAQTPQPTDGQTHKWTTRERDAFTCIPMQSGLTGEGFLMQTASGLRYTFDIAVSRYLGYMTRSAGEGLPSYSVSRVKYYLLASKITDRFGNTVTFQYNAAGNPTSITSSDGRAITLTYTSGNLTSATANGRTWQYQYGTGATTGMLTAVVQPDASKWQYAYTGTLSPDAGAVWDGGTGANCGIKPPIIPASFGLIVTHPSGAVGTFQFANARHFRAGVHVGECVDHMIQQDGTWYTDHILHTPNYFDVMNLTTKTITGAGIAQPMTWNYNYGITHQNLWGSGDLAVYPCITCPTEKLVTVTQPDSTQVQYRYGFLYAVNEGRLLGSSVLDTAGVVKKVDTTTYMTDAEAATQNFWPRYGIVVGGGDPTTAAIRPVTRQAIQQDGMTFTMSVNQGCGGTAVYCFDLYRQHD